MKAPKTKKPKDPVKIRYRELANGEKSIYLDTYIKGAQAYEFLNLHLLPENAPNCALHNMRVSLYAYQAKVQRTKEILEGKPAQPLPPPRPDITPPQKSVKIRFKELADGGKSIYLDTYQKGARAYEFLNLYLLPEETPEAITANAATMEKAEAIRQQRIIENKPIPEPKPKIKIPVRIGTKRRTNGKRQIYLDIRQNGKRKQEHLRLYLLPEGTPEAIAANAATMEKAEAIRQERTEQLKNNTPQ